MVTLVVNLTCGCIGLERLHLKLIDIHLITVDMSTGGQQVVKMVKDPVTQDFTGHATIKMRSADQANWVMSDLNDFVVNMGPRPLHASVAISGMQ